MTEALHLGWDLSTQQLKSIVVQSDLKLVYEANVDFDKDLAKYGIEKGVRVSDDGSEVWAPNAMFLEALDLNLQRLEEMGLDFSNVKSVSGAGMQHVAIFWNTKAKRLLNELSGNQSLFEQLNDAFSCSYSKNWQDVSTQDQCDAFDTCLGDESTLAYVTGSKAHHRYTGPQILRFRQKDPEAYRSTARISLISSFVATLFLGDFAPIDISDVCGMNFWDIEKANWNDSLLALAAGDHGVEDLKSKLGPVPLDGGLNLGNVSKYFVERYGFSPDCSVIPFTGDNPATILSLPLQASDAIVSLGTSTTFLMSTPEYKPHPSYHFMNHPTTEGLYMFMLCYKNGSGARENVRDDLNTFYSREKHSWDCFNATVTSSPPLNQPAPTSPMKLGLFFPRPEIVPNVPAGEWTYLWDPHTRALTSISPLKADSRINTPNTSTQVHEQVWIHPNDTARATLESQFLSLRLRSSRLVQPQPSTAGRMQRPQPRRIYLVGGGSVNDTIAEVCGEVLGGAEGVYRLDIGGNACALGAAYKAVWATGRRGCETFEEFIAKRWDEGKFVKKVDQGYREGVWEKYGEAVSGFDLMEIQVLEKVKRGA